MSESEKVWELHHTIYKQLRKRAQSLEGEVSKELKSYERNQRKFASREFTGATHEELFSSIRDSHVVFLGDFHSFDQNSRNLERLTRELIKQKKKFCLGVELVHEEHQSVIEQYLNRQITELEFLESIDYHETWRFPWTYYRPFFEMARHHNLPIVAINSSGNLDQRDERAAEILKNFILRNPNERLLVLIGELHIVPNKLPLKLKKAVANLVPHYRDTIIHQNLDEVYWKIHELEIEKHNRIIKFSDQEFSLQTSPPWIKYESIIYWHENLSDDPEFELHDYLMDTGILNLHSNVPENFLFLCEKIMTALNLQVHAEEMEDFNLYEHQNLSLILDKVGRLPKATLSNFLKKLVATGRVFRIPFSNNYYCSSYSINRMSFLCGLHLQDICIRKQDINYESVLMKEGLDHKFVLMVKQNTMGYLASKVINPFRKCDRYLDFKEKGSSDLSPEQLKVYQSLLKIIDSDGTLPFKEQLETRSLYFAYECARRLGFYLGDILYEDFLIKNSPLYRELFKFLLNNTVEYCQFYDFLRILLPEGRYGDHKKRMF